MRKLLIDYRKSIGFTQQQLADRLKVSKAVISAIELGKLDGSIKFWESLQKELHIDNSKMWELIITNESRKTPGKNKLLRKAS